MRKKEISREKKGGTRNEHKKEEVKKRGGAERMIGEPESYEERNQFTTLRPPHYSPGLPT